MAAVGQACDLAQPQLAAQQPHLLIGEHIGNPASVQAPFVFLKSLPWHRAASAFAIGEDVELSINEPQEKLWAVASAVEDNRQASLSDQGARLLQQDRQHLHHAGVCLGRDDEERTAALDH